MGPLQSQWDTLSILQRLLGQTIWSRDDERAGASVAIMSLWVVKGAELKEGRHWPGASYQIMSEAISSSCTYLSVTLCEPLINSFQERKKERKRRWFRYNMSVDLYLEITVGYTWSYCYSSVVCELITWNFAKTIRIGKFFKKNQFLECLSGLVHKSRVHKSIVH